MFPLALTLGAAAVTAWFATPAAATSCTAFDSYFNLYGFGINGRDFSFGPQSGWGNVPTGQVMPTTGRPPFDGPNTQCFTAEYFNVIYVLNGDAKQPNAIHIFDATSKTWTTQQTTMPNGLDPTNMKAILDHDTNVFFAMSNGNLFSVEMGELKAASPTPVAWGASNPPNFDVSNYKPVMALAQNHIHFLNIGGDAGLARIFVIHFAYWQPEIQSYAAGNNAGTFPQQHGQVASFFTGDTQAQKKFAFLPDDMSNTYIIDIDKNTTTTLPAPPASAGFPTNPDGLMGRLSASPTALVYLSPSGDLRYISIDQNNVAANTKWGVISSPELVAAAAANPSSSGSNSSVAASGSVTATASGMATSHVASATSTGAHSASMASSTASANGAETLRMGMSAALAAALVGFQAWLIL